MTTRPSPGARRREPFPLRTLGLVAIGAAAGALAREAALRAGDPHAVVAIINIVGTFVLGLLVARAPKHLQALVGTGFCGGLTTFSTVALMAVQDGWPGAGWVVLDLGGAVAAAWAAWALAGRGRR
ncbi:hypothetical protein GCM10027418_05120 [Mariniluteicoccus endophyticus]